MNALPGADPFDAATERRLADLAAGHAFTNRLALETSPYLLQHAHNPVDWAPWGDEAFARARRQNRPILLSVGYSTCHWCHVMEHESFESTEIAEVLNRLYVPIKVDREERPDVDAVYMTAVQLLSGHGGWPMTVWLLPNGQPFYAGTYIPPVDGARGQRVGFKTMLLQLRELFDTRPDRLEKAATELVSGIEESFASSRGAGGGFDDRAAAQAPSVALAHCKRRFDASEGGVSGAPKFPSSLPLRFLLRRHEAIGDLDAAKMVRLTLDKMADGGIYDHLAGGFHRYSTDAVWLVPHFEKMLYDNALLATVYAEAFSLFREPRDAGVCREILDYVLRDMCAPSGAFYSATDADSLTPDGHRDEGYFFTWTQAEIKDALGDEAEAFCLAYGVSAEGNFEGRSVLSVQSPEARVRFASARATLLSIRQARPQPLRDDKHVTAWNGLMIAALAKAGFILAEPRYVAAAQRAGEWLFAERFSAANGFSRVRRDGPGFLDDQANMLLGCVELFLATSDGVWIERANALVATLKTGFEDREHGGFFSVPANGERLIARDKPSYDGAEPSGNSVATYALLRLARLVDDEALTTLAERCVGAFSGVLERAPYAMSEMLLALDLQTRPKVEVAVIGDDRRKTLLNVLRDGFFPGAVWAEGDDSTVSALASVLPFLAGRGGAEGARAHVCVDRACLLPVTTVEDMQRALLSAGSTATEAPH